MKTFSFPKNIYFPEMLLHEPNGALDACMGLVDIMKKKILSNLNVDPIVGLICPIPSGETKFYWLAP